MSNHGHDKPVFGCDRCIAEGDRGTDAAVKPGEVPSGWDYYRVDVTKTYTSYYYVLAPSEEAAQDDANEIVLTDYDFSQDDYETWVTKAKTPPYPGEPLWTGGPEGIWTEVKESDK